jgi:hypothetical protein
MSRRMLATICDKIDQAKVLSAHSLLYQRRDCGVLNDIREAEFKVFSQFGDDGIIQYLITRAVIEQETFIEFGVEDYSESNTRFLLVHNNWKGLVMDGSEANIRRIREEAISWRHDLTALHRFITRDNINEAIASAGFTGPIGLLSIDIDGNDYWIWEALTVAEPTVIVVEYNSLFGRERAVVVPYRPDFERARAHYSHLFWGCSLKALCLLARAKGYIFVGCNSNGNNAYFVRGTGIGPLTAKTVESGFVMSRFRDSRDRQGALSYTGGPARLKLISDMVVQDLEADRLVRLGEVAEWKPAPH